MGRRVQRCTSTPHTVLCTASDAALLASSRSAFCEALASRALISTTARRSSSRALRIRGGEGAIRRAEAALSPRRDASRSPAAQPRDAAPHDGAERGESAAARRRASRRLEWVGAAPVKCSRWLPRSGSVRRTGARKRRNASFATQSIGRARLRAARRRAARDEFASCRAPRPEDVLWRLFIRSVVGRRAHLRCGFGGIKNNKKS